VVPPKERCRVAVLISGRGSNMASLIEAAQAPGYPAEIALVLSNRPEAPGLARAAAAGIATAVVDHKTHPEREAFERALDHELRAHRVELLCLAGFMRILTPWFIDRWLGRMLNVHPSLLPLFKGLHTHRRALEEGVRIHGCTVHFVTPELDSGPIVAQAAVPVLPSDTEEALVARVLRQEHVLYPLALGLVAGGKVRLKQGRVEVDADWDEDAALVSPLSRVRRGAGKGVG
jgi:phosphoribosylglycinamide formyltransferase-1